MSASTSEPSCSLTVTPLDMSETKKIAQARITVNSEYSSEYHAMHHTLLVLAKRVLTLMTHLRASTMIRHHFVHHTTCDGTQHDNGTIIGTEMKTYSSVFS